VSNSLLAEVFSASNGHLRRSQITFSVLSSAL